MQESKPGREVKRMEELKVEDLGSKGVGGHVQKDDDRMKTGLAKQRVLREHYKFCPMQSGVCEMVGLRAPNDTTAGVFECAERQCACVCAKERETP